MKVESGRKEYTLPTWIVNFDCDAVTQIKTISNTGWGGGRSRDWPNNLPSDDRYGEKGIIVAA